MKRKISTTLAVTLIASQVQGAALAETITNIQEVDVINENLPQTTGNSNQEIITDESIKNELQEQIIVEEMLSEEVKEETVEDTVIEEEKIEEVAEETVVEEETREDEIVEVEQTENYELKGKLELDMNFSMPIKYKISDETNISVDLKKEDKVLGTVKLGSDITTGIIEGTNITYNLEALNSKRATLEDDATELEFYHLTFENIELGTYSLEISGDGYETAIIQNIDIQDTSKRVLVGTSDKTIVIDEKEEVYPGVFLGGDVDKNNSVTSADYDDVKEKIKNGNGNKSHDLNRDGKVDITDLTYVHQNMDKEKKEAIILDTDIIINPEKTDINVDNEVVKVEGDIKDILKDNGTSVKLEPKDGEVISENNPITIPINLAGIARSGASVEKITIEAPTETAPGTGSVVIPNGNGEGQDLVVKFDETNSKKIDRKTRDNKEMDVIEIDLGKQVAVSQITINVTGGRGNKNLTEIAKVDFLNNVYKELPEPKMNIPVINNFKSTTQVGQESMTLGWNHETNVTGYELKVEQLNDKNQVVNTKYYKTSENTLRIEKVEGYATYRVSIQSLSGDWKSGYKDEQEGYVSTSGETNLKNTANDKDGKPDNVDGNYKPQAWDSISGKLESNADGENGSNFGADSIVELQVIPETAPEGPEGITIEGQYKGLKINWKSHKKAKDYDLYYREIGTGEWIKANDPNGDYKDSNADNDIPDGVADLTPEEKTDENELIRGTTYTITGLKDTTAYEIMMTATNHHGTGGLSNTYIGSTTSLVAPKTTNYNLINVPNGENELTKHIESVEFKGGTTDDVDSVVDNDYSTAWTFPDWDTSIYGKNGPIVTFDEEYTIDTINVITRLDISSQPYSANIGFLNEKTGKWEYKDARVNLSDKNRVATLTLNEPITAKKVQVNLSVYPTVASGKVNISEIKFYKYDSLEKDVDSLFADDLKLTIKDDVNQEKIDELTKRAKTIDPITMEYHPKQKEILEDLQRAQDLLNDIKLNDKILKLDPLVINGGNTIGQSNNWQSLGVAVKPGDKVTVYIGSNRENTTFNLAISQHYGESGSYITNYSQKLVVGKNEITIPDSPFNMNYEKGGNLYINFNSNYNEGQNVQVRVSGGTMIPHLNINNMIDNTEKETEVKDAIRNYIRELKSYVRTVQDRYPKSATSQDNANNIYTYDAETSILNTTEIEGERITLTLPADQVLKGIQEGLGGNEEAEVNRVYDTLLAWEQLMKVSYAQQGLLENPVDFDGDGAITNNINLEELGGKTEQKFFEENRAPRNRMNIKYQRMFTGAFMYASGHHVGIGYGSASEMMKGVPFKFDENGKLINAESGNLFGWGIGHEIGHVHDIAGLTYTETTNNILALITQTFDDIDASRLESSGVYEKMYDKVTSGSVGLASDISTRLGMFWQLHLAYDNDYTYNMIKNNTDGDLSNDTVYAKLYRETRKRGVASNESGHDATAQTFIMRASDAVSKDLRPFFEKWGLIASPNTNDYLDKAGYPVEDKAIYYLNDEARRIRLEAGADTSKITMAPDTKVNATFGTDKQGNPITEKTYLDQKEVPLTLSVSKDADKILGYEIIRKEATSVGTREVTVGFALRDKNSENGLTNYVDVIDAVNNRAFTYKVKAYDYNLNVTEITEIGNVKVNHEGSIVKSNWIFDTNTRSADDVVDENTGHGQVQDGSINNIKDNNPSTVYNGLKITDGNGQEAKGDPYVTIDMGDSKSVIGLKYTPGTSGTKKFSLRNIFKWNKEITYEAISNYEVHVSKDGTNWTRAHSGKFDTTKENTIYFNESGNSDNSQLWAYDAKYVKIIAKGASTISIGEIDILGPTGDNIEIGIDNGDKVYENGVGRLKSEYEYAEGKSIPAGSIIVTGEYKGDPAFNIPLVLNEEDENFAIEAQAILLANLPEDAELGEVAEGNWIYWITPDQEAKIINGENNIKGNAIKAELYRYNKLDDKGSPVGQRLVSDTFLVDVPSLDNLPTIDLNGGSARAIKPSYDKIVEVNSDIMKKALENR